MSFLCVTCKYCLVCLLSNLINNEYCLVSVKDKLPKKVSTTLSLYHQPNIDNGVVESRLINQQLYCCSNYHLFIMFPSCPFINPTFPSTVSSNLFIKPSETKRIINVFDHINTMGIYDSYSMVLVSFWKIKCFRMSNNYNMEL